MEKGFFIPNCNDYYNIWGELKNSKSGGTSSCISSCRGCVKCISSCRGCSKPVMNENNINW